MKNFFTTLLALIFFQYLLLDAQEDKTDDLPEYFNPAPETQRVPHHYDWDKQRYIYEDEVPPEPKPDKVTPLTHSPDSYVEIMEPRSKSKEGEEFDSEDISLPDVIIGGKRYRQQKLPNNQIKLIPIR